jgi:hypothetical protein
MEGHVQPAQVPLGEYFLRIVSLLNGDDQTTYSMWKLAQPGGDPRKVGDIFIQAAGSAQALAVEARVRTNDGGTHLFALARPEPASAEPTTIRLDDQHGFEISSNEVFTAEEAAPIFLTFYLTDTVAQPYQLRELNFGDG